MDRFLADQGLKVHTSQGRKLAKHPTGPRAIDREAGVRTRPMRVIVASMSRTAMYAGLQQLGYWTYHMAESVKMPERDLEIACEALKASRLGEGKPFGREEFDKWLGDFDAVSDVPSCLLVKELVEAYPDTKVVLPKAATTRDPAKWRASMETTIVAVSYWRIWRVLAPISPECRAFHRFCDLLLEIMDGWSIDALLRHNAQVREVVPKDRLLEFKLGQDGWKELCGFLEVPQPEGEFPNVNDGGMFRTIVFICINVWMLKALKRVAVRLAPVGMAVGAIWYAKRQGFF